MNEDPILISATSRAAASRNAGQYLRELLRSDQKYKRRWMQHQHDRQRDVHQISVAKVLAAELRRHPRTPDDADISYQQLVHTVSRALKPRGTVLAKETLELFIKAFEMTDEHAEILWRQWEGDEPARVVIGQLGPLGGGRAPATPYQMVSLREYHYLGPDGRPVKHRTARDIRSLVDGLTQCRYCFDTSEVTVEHISGGTPGPPYRLYENIWAVDIALPRTLNKNDEHSLEFETRFHSHKPAETCLRRVAHERFENVVLRVEFHPDCLPRQVFWTEWLDYRYPNVLVLREDPVTLDAEHAANQRLNVLSHAVVGYRWEF